MRWPGCWSFGRAARTAAFAALLGAAALGCEGSENPLSASEPELLSITIEGNHALKAGTIKGRLATTATSWIPFSTKQYLDLAVLQSDRHRMERLYQAHGYFDARVKDVRVTYDAGHTKARVVIVVEENEPTRIQSVLVQGTDDLPAEVRRGVQSSAESLEAGKVFDEEAFEGVKQAIRVSMRQAGYAEVAVTGQAQIDAPAHQCLLRFVVVPGRRFTFGPVVVSGNHAVGDDFIKEKVVDEAEPGRFYSDTALQAAQNRILDMGVFSLARVTHGPIPPDGGAAELPIDVAVTEAPFRTLRAGPGIDIEPLRQEVRGEFEWIHRNFFGGLRKLDWDTVLGYVVTPSVIQAVNGSGGVNQGPAGHSKLSFTQPDFVFHDLDLNTSLELSRDIELGYTYNTGTVSLGVDRRWGRALHLSAAYNFQLIQVQGQINSAYLSQTSTPGLASNCPGTSCFLRLSYLEERVSWDRRDNAIEPHEGYRLSVDLEEGGGPGASFQFYKLRPEARGYIPLGSDFTLGLRAAWGAIAPFGSADQSTPITQRFYGGGPNDVRAYGSRLMSPVLVACVPGKLGAIDCTNNQAIPVGGNGSLLGSAELRIRLSHSFSVVPFVDVGEVTVDPYTYSAVDLAVAPGLGLRYITLFGPIRLDVAYRLPNLAPGTRELRLAPSEVVVNYPPTPNSFYPQSEPTVNRLDVQFSIGEAF